MSAYHLTNNDGMIRYEDPQLVVEVNFRDNAGNIQQISKRLEDGTWATALYGAGYSWGASPKGIPDGGNGFAQTTEYHDDHFDYNVEQHETLLKLNWYQKVHRYKTDEYVGIESWGSYELPYNSSIIKVWNRFLISDTNRFHSLFGTRELFSYSSNLDEPARISDVHWPTNNTRSGDMKTRSYATNGGDWTQPDSTWSGSTGCVGSDRYRSDPNPYYELFSRSVRDARCHPRVASNASLGTLVEAAKANVPSSIPYAIHRDPASGLSVGRVLTGNSGRRLTIQTYDNGGLLSPDTVFSSGISWDWGDGAYELWPLSGWQPPALQNGFQLSTNEELWLGQGTADSMRSWIKSVHSAY